MFAGNVVCERRLYWSASLPEPYFGRDMRNHCENPALRIQPIGGECLSINVVWP
jgi:hypothetical protein